MAKQLPDSTIHLGLKEGKGSIVKKCGRIIGNVRSKRIRRRVERLDVMLKLFFILSLSMLKKVDVNAKEIV